MPRVVNQQNCKWNGKVDGWKWSFWPRTRNRRDKDKWGLTGNENRRGLRAWSVSYAAVLPKDKLNGRVSVGNESF